MSQTFDSVACSLAESPIGVASRGTPSWQDHPATVVLNVGAGGRAHWGHRIDLCLVYRQPLPHWGSQVGLTLGHRFSLRASTKLVDPFCRGSGTVDARPAM